MIYCFRLFDFAVLRKLKMSPRLLTVCTTCAFFTTFRDLFFLVCFAHRPRSFPAKKATPHELSSEATLAPLLGLLTQPSATSSISRLWLLSAAVDERPCPWRVPLACAVLDAKPASSIGRNASENATTSRATSPFISLQNISPFSRRPLPLFPVLCSLFCALLFFAGSLEGMIRGLSGTAIDIAENDESGSGREDDGQLQGQVKGLEHGVKQGGKVSG